MRIKIKKKKCVICKKKNEEKKIIRGALAEWEIYECINDSFVLVGSIYMIGSGPRKIHDIIDGHLLLSFTADLILLVSSWT